MNKLGSRTGAQAPQTEARADGVSRVARVNFEAELKALLEGCKDVADCLTTLRSDKAWADAHPEKVYISKNSPGQGEDYALYRARRRIAYADLDAFLTAYERAKKATK